MKLILKRILLIILTGTSILTIWNLVCKKGDQSKIEDAYGQEVEVGEKNMVVDIRGE